MNKKETEEANNEQSNQGMSDQEKRAAFHRVGEELLKELGGKWLTDKAGQTFITSLPKPKDEMKTTSIPPKKDTEDKP
jgi:hypothetical protein